MNEKVEELGHQFKTHKMMMEEGTKNQIVNLDSKKQTWENMEIPANIINNLMALSFTKPSIIQGLSIPKVLSSNTENFVFQALNGSGKTGAFAIPSIMKVDTSVNKI